MDYKFHFVADSIKRNKAYPALAVHRAEPYTPKWRQFGQHWPFTVPVELHEHCNTHNFPFSLYSTTEQIESPAWYTIGLGFFNFDIDYMGMLPVSIKQKAKQKAIRLLFYYHEGDNPFNIKARLDDLCRWHKLPTDCYKFVSGNTQADHIQGFAWFPDHELLFWHRNQQVPPCEIHQNPRPYKFTILNRTHKWWRATAMADLWHQGLLQHSQWSYRTDVDCGDRPEDNPIEIDSFDDLRSQVDEFLAGCPYTCDNMTVDQQNDHHQTHTQHFSHSWCSIILETHFDADGSQGAFLTEKTFRAIKHGHPFVIVGCPGSLNALRKLGYRTFDHAIDNSYDQEINNTQRWARLRQLIAWLSQQDLATWFQSVRADVEHNQRLFAESKYGRLNTLFTKLHQS